MILETATNDEIVELLISARHISSTYSAGALNLKGKRVCHGGKWYDEGDLEREIDRRMKYGKVIRRD